MIETIKESFDDSQARRSERTGTGIQIEYGYIWISVCAVFWQCDALDIWQAMRAISWTKHHKFC